MKKYKLINNTLGWLIFVIAAATYLLTIEPTASFWDCPEFIAQGFKTEIGHPPGNPIFILAANFASKFAGGDVMAVAKCVNAMSAIFSALTILLLFWSITHLVKKLVVKDGTEDHMSLAQYLVIMGSGICGALVYTWSDTFWFSAVEAEVYAFSSFCTALVFWLILKWENRADEPQSDRWIILIAYVIGVSLGVHLLNLLCIPAIALVFYYRQCRAQGKNSSVKGSLLTLLVSFVVLGLILYGLKPGFVKWGQLFDLFCVNTLHMPFNTGALLYSIVLLALLGLSLFALYRNNSDVLIKVTFALAMLFSGIFFLGGNVLALLFMMVLLCVYLFSFCKKVPVRILTNITLSVLVIFIGFSSYALILIRSSQNTPLDENSPNNTFALAKYLSREQYGDTPLLKGRTVYSDVLYTPDGTAAMKEGDDQYAPEVKTAPGQPDRYRNLGPKKSYHYVPEQDMWFPRIYDDRHLNEYVEWLGMRGEQVEASSRVDSNGDIIEGSKEMKMKPTMMENLRFFVSYQLNYMYWRYFMWNFAGRQNDIQGMGEITHGNWISGIPLIDNKRLGDQSLLPDDLGKGNKGHNVFYMLPLLMGLLGLLWQAFRGRRGIEQFWVVFFLFFMTGIAIVLYLNQAPSQPRERDYAYAGSFYAYSIWVGMGVAALWYFALWVLKLLGVKKKASDEETKLAGQTVAKTEGKPTANKPKPKKTQTIISAVVGAIVIVVMLNVLSDYGYLIQIVGSALPCAAALALTNAIIGDNNKKTDTDLASSQASNTEHDGAATAVAAVAALIGILVPLQMVSQTWDDHDRSGRYAARDFGRNYLSSVAPNGIIFCNGDNDTFPLWYLQEVEGYRTDVRAVNLSYLATDWYISQMKRAAYESAPLPMLASDTTFAYDRRVMNYIWQPDMTPTEALTSLAELYKPESKIPTSQDDNLYELRYPNMYIPVNADQAIKAGVVKPEQRNLISDSISMDLQRVGKGFTSSQVMSLDIIASSIAEGWGRPCYFAMTVPDNLYLGLDPYLRLTGLAYQVTPLALRGRDDIRVSTDIMYDNVMTQFKWGGLDSAKAEDIYLDETISRMVTTTRSAMLDLAGSLMDQGILAKQDKYPVPEGLTVEKYVADRYSKARKVLDLMMEKLPTDICPFAVQMGEQAAQYYYRLGGASGDSTCIEKSKKILESEILRYGQYVRYYQSLSQPQYSSLTRTDKYIDQQYLLNLLADYGEYFGDDAYVKEIVPKLQDIGVNLERQLQFQNAYEESIRQQQQARIQAQQQAMQQAAEGGEEASAELQGMFAN